MEEKIDPMEIAIRALKELAKTGNEIAKTAIEHILLVCDEDSDGKL